MGLIEKFQSLNTELEKSVNNSQQLGDNVSKVGTEAGVAVEKLEAFSAAVESGVPAPGTKPTFIDHGDVFAPERQARRDSARGGSGGGTGGSGRSSFSPPSDRDGQARLALALSRRLNIDLFTACEMLGFDYLTLFGGDHSDPLGNVKSSRIGGSGGSGSGSSIKEFAGEVGKAISNEIRPVFTDLVGINSKIGSSIQELSNSLKVSSSSVKNSNESGALK